MRHHDDGCPGLIDLGEQVEHAVGIGAVAWWARRVRARPELSPTRRLDAFWRSRQAEVSEHPDQRMGLGTWLIVITALSIILLALPFLITWALTVFQQRGATR